MPVHHAVLSLLNRRPSYGYELKTLFEQAVGPQWGPLNIGHLYQVLERLSRDGLVTSTLVEQAVRPDRVVYEITESGREEMVSWMRSASPRAAAFRDDLFLKVVCAAMVQDVDVFVQVVSRQRATLLHELRNLEQMRRERRDQPLVNLLLAAAARHVTADLSFLDDVENGLLANQATALRATAIALAADQGPTDVG